MNDAKEEIRARLAIEDVVGQYIELKRKGRTFEGHSPWGVDKTPSFMVSPEKGIWHDFSANRGGDIFSFVMEVEGISFREALEKLAAQAGVDLSKYKGGDKEVSKKKARAKEALELACKYYQVCLAKNKPVCEYVFYKRNLNRATVKDFRIGYSPKEGKALVEFLMKKGFSRQEMADAGLLNRFNGDMFRGRMMVPFIDTTGNVIGFTARVLDKSEPKYLNTPETLLFNKGRFIFGFYQAKEAIRKNGFVVIVEGNMDVISSHQAGVREAVATSGTAMTEMHLKALSKLTDDIRLAYDGDEAGVKATERAIKMAGDLGIKLSVISDYGGAKDPDELIQKSADLWMKAVEKRMPAVDWLLEKYEERFDLKTADGKQEYSDLAMELLKYLPKVRQRHYRQLVAEKLNVEMSDLSEAKGDAKRRLKEIKITGNGRKNDGILDRILAILIYGKVGDAEDFEIPKEKDKLAELEMVFEKFYNGWTKENLEIEFEELNKKAKDKIVDIEIEELKAKLSSLSDDEEDKVNEILQKIQDLQKTEKK
ncbi:DNA primase [Candidatus Saccharibacteria bacterium]|nr:DNA primase [Candidatus Saccharibacteria bacterium]